MKDFAKSLIKGFGIGGGIFLAYLVFVSLIKSGIIPSSNELSTFFQSHEKVTMVHAIGVYEGDYPDGVSHRTGFHPDGRIDLLVKNNPNASGVILVLSSYEPVNWHVKVDKGAKIDKIILSGYHQNKVTGIDAIPILRENLGYAYKRTSFSGMETKIKELTGLEVSTFQGNYKGKHFDIF